MIVHYFDVFGVSFVPAKADAGLIVDPDAVLSDPIPLDETGDPFALEQPLGIGAAKRPDHLFRILRFT